MKKISKTNISEEDYLLLRDMSIKLKEIARRSNLISLEVYSSNLNENDDIDSYISFKTENIKSGSVLSDNINVEFINNMKIIYY